MTDTYSVRVYCGQCETSQLMQVQKGHSKDEAEEMKCPNCGMRGEIDLDY